MPNHVHLVFGVLGDPDASDLLATWKSYASRALNRLGSKSKSPRWFADGGSKRPLKGEAYRVAAIRYVRDQMEPLLVWLSDEAKTVANEEPVLDMLPNSKPGS